MPMMLYDVINKIYDALAVGLAAERMPQFQVIETVIVLNSILVVDTFLGGKWPTQDALHFEAMLVLPPGFGLNEGVAIAVWALSTDRAFFNPFRRPWKCNVIKGAAVIMSVIAVMT